MKTNKKEKKYGCILSNIALLGTINLTKQENIHTDYKSSQCMHYAITFLGSNELKRNEIMYFKQIEYH